MAIHGGGARLDVDESDRPPLADLMRDFGVHRGGAPPGVDLSIDNPPVRAPLRPSAQARRFIDGNPRRGAGAAYWVNWWGSTRTRRRLHLCPPCIMLCPRRVQLGSPQLD